MKNLINKVVVFVSPYISKIQAYYFSLSPKLKKLLIIAGGMLGLLLAMLIIALVVKSISNRPVKRVVLPTPAVTALPTPVELTNPSKYATDSAVLKLEENLKDNENKLNNLDIKESNLYPPQLDFEINFPL